jgi:hypothetical protein
VFSFVGWSVVIVLTMGKGKGRQSGGFSSKSLRAAYSHEIQQQVYEPRPSQPTTKQSSTSERPSSTSERPRLTRLSQLKGILRERQSQEEYEILQRRQRQGFVPRRPEPSKSKEEENPAVSNPPGFILYYDDNQCNDLKKAILPSNKTAMMESLQSRCVKVLGQYLPAYLEALGGNDLHAALSLLPSETLAALTVLISSTVGMTNELATVLGKHAHAERLSLHSALPTTDDEDATCLTDECIWSLVPHLPSDAMTPTHESWEDLLDTAFALDILHMEGCSIRLKRLELVNCSSVSREPVLALFSKCAGITHLSLAGSLSLEDGPTVMMRLPDLLPALQVLDVSTCAWATFSLLQSFRRVYDDWESQGPLLICRGVFIPWTSVAINEVGPEW